MEQITSVRMRNKCKLCNEPVDLEPDRSAKTKIWIRPRKNPKFEEKEVITAGKPSCNHEWGLCYFHKKRFEGLFDLKYPLSRFRLENAKIKGNFEMLRKSNKIYAQKLNIGERVQAAEIES